MLSRISRSTTTKLNVNAEETFNRLAMAVDFESVLEDWQQPCAQEGISLSKNVIAEFKKKIKEAGLAGTAAHLDLRHGLLNARQISLLILVLSKKPVISRLEVRAEEVTNEALEAIEYVLQLQIKNCREIDLDNRLQACYLGDLILDGKTTHLDQQLLNKVQQSCAVLKYANARAFIRATYLDDNASAQSKSTVQNSYVEKLWGKIFGVLDSPRIQKAYRSARIGTKEWIRYNELERILVCGFIERGSLVDIGEELMERVDCTSNEQFRSSSSDYGGKGQSSYDEEDSPMQSRHEIREQLSSPIPNEVKSSSAGGGSNLDNLARKLAEIEAMSANQNAFFSVEKKSIPYEHKHEQLVDHHMSIGNEEDEEEMRPLDDGDEYDKESEKYTKRKETVPETKVIVEKSVAADVKPPIVTSNNSSAISSTPKLTRGSSFLVSTEVSVVKKPLQRTLSSTVGSGGSTGDVLPTSKHSSGTGVSSIEAKLLELEAMMKVGGAPFVTSKAVAINNNNISNNSSNVNNSNATIIRPSTRTNMHDSASDTSVTIASKIDTKKNSKAFIGTESPSIPILIADSAPLPIHTAIHTTASKAEDTENKETTSSPRPPYIDESNSQNNQTDTITVSIAEQYENIGTNHASMEAKIETTHDLPLITHESREQDVIASEENTVIDNITGVVIEKPVASVPIVVEETNKTALLPTNASIVVEETNKTALLPTNIAPIEAEEVLNEVTTLPEEQAETACTGSSDTKENKENTEKGEEMPKENIFSKWKKMSQQNMKQPPLPISPQNISNYYTGVKKNAFTESSSKVAESAPVYIASEDTSLASLKNSVNEVIKVNLSEVVPSKSKPCIESDMHSAPQFQEIKGDIVLATGEDMLSSTVVLPTIISQEESLTKVEIPSVSTTSSIIAAANFPAVRKLPSLTEGDIFMESQNVSPETNNDQFSELTTVITASQVKKIENHEKLLDPVIDEKASDSNLPMMIPPTQVVETSPDVLSTTNSTTAITSTIATTTAVKTKVVPVSTPFIPAEQRKSKTSSSSPAKVKPHGHSHTRGETLSLSDRALTDIAPWSNIISEEDSLNITELFLQNNHMSSLPLLTLAQQFQHLRICDLSNNLLRGKIETHDFPLTLTSLNISHNNLVDIYGLTACASLTSLNVSHNLIKNLFGVPAKLVVLDISFNKIFAVNSVRSLMLSTKLTNLSIEGNPVMDAIANPRIYFTSFLFNLQVLNGRRLIPEKRKAPEVYHPVSTIGYHPGNISFAERPAIHRSPPRSKRTTSPTKLTLAEQQQQLEKLCSDKKKKPSSDNHYEEDSKAKKATKKLLTNELDKVVNRLSAPRHMIPKKEDETNNLSLHSKAEPKVVIAGGKTKPSNTQQHQHSEVTSSIESLPSYSSSSVNNSNNKRLTSSSVTSASKTKTNKISVPDQVELWLQQKKEQLQSVADIFRIPFGLSTTALGDSTNQDKDSNHTLDAEALAAFDGCVENAKIYLEIPLYIRKAIKNDLIDQALLRSVDEVMTQMDKALALLQQIQTVGLLSCVEDETGAVIGYNSKQYAKALEIMMRSPAGQFVNDTILKPHNCAYQPNVAGNKQPKHDVSRTLQQEETVKKFTPSKAANSNNNKRSISSPQIPVTDNQKGNISEQEGEFSHHIRDVQQDADNNDHSQRIIKMVLFPESEEGDTDSLSYHKQNSVHSSGNNTSNSRTNFDPSPFMDRMRQRIARKFIPSVYLEANEPTGLAMTEEQQEKKQTGKGTEEKQAIESSTTVKTASVIDEITTNNNNSINKTISISNNANNNVAEVKDIVVAQQEVAKSKLIEEESISSIISQETPETTVTLSMVATESSALKTLRTDNFNVLDNNNESTQVKKEDQEQELPSNSIVNTEIAQEIVRESAHIPDTAVPTKENESQETTSFKRKETKVEMTIVEKNLVTEKIAILPAELPSVVPSVDKKNESVAVAERSENNDKLTAMRDKEDKIKKNEVDIVEFYNELQNTMDEKTINHKHYSNDSNNNVLTAEQEKTTISVSEIAKREDNVNSTSHNAANVMVEESPKLRQKGTEDPSNFAISSAKTTPIVTASNVTSSNEASAELVVSAIPITPSHPTTIPNSAVQCVSNISNDNTINTSIDSYNNDTTTTNTTKNSSNVSAKALVVPAVPVVMRTAVTPTVASVSMSNVDRFKLRMQLQREKSNAAITIIASAGNTTILDNDNDNNNNNNDNNTTVGSDTSTAANGMSDVSPTQTETVSSNMDSSSSNTDLTYNSMASVPPLPIPPLAATAVEVTVLSVSVAPPSASPTPVSVTPVATPSVNPTTIINNNNAANTGTSNAAIVSSGGRSFADRLASLRAKEQQQQQQQQEVQKSPEIASVSSSTIASSHSVDSNNNNNYNDEIDKTDGIASLPSLRPPPRDTDRDTPASAWDTATPPTAASTGYQSDRSHSYVSGSEAASRTVTPTTAAEDAQLSLPENTVSFATAATVVSARERLRARLAKNKQQQQQQQSQDIL